MVSFRLVKYKQLLQSPFKFPFKKRPQPSSHFPKSSACIRVWTKMRLCFMRTKLQQLSCYRRSQWSILQCLFYWLRARQSTWALTKASHFHTTLISASPSRRFARCVPRKERKNTQQDISSPEAELCYADVIVRLGYDNLLFLPPFSSECLENQCYVVRTLTVAAQNCILSPQSGSPPLWNAVPPPSRPPSRSRCALSCCEPPCWGRRGRGGAAVALRACRRWWTWSTTPSSRASPRTANRSWWCVWLGCRRTATRWRSLNRRCWISCTGAETGTEQRRALRCDENKIKLSN